MILSVKQDIKASLPQPLQPLLTRTGTLMVSRENTDNIVHAHFTVLGLRCLLMAGKEHY